MRSSERSGARVSGKGTSHDRPALRLPHNGRAARADRALTGIDSAAITVVNIPSQIDSASIVDEVKRILREGIDNALVESTAGDEPHKFLVIVNLPDCAMISVVLIALRELT